MQFYIIIGFILAFLFYSLINRGENNKPLLFHTIIINKYHFHHWMNFLALFLLLIPIIFYYGYNKFFAFLLGVCLGSILQGLTYKDAFKLRVK